jgi:hypothetical protein
VKTSIPETPKQVLHYCRALSWIRVKGEWYPIMPIRSLVYLILGAACIMVAFVATQRVITATESSQILATSGWDLENQHINQMDEAKVEATLSDPVWRSKGFPSVPKEEGQERILVLGDSFVWGNGYANMNDIWWRQLQRELYRRGYWNVQVVAAGLNGASTQEEFRELRESDLISRLQIDAVVIGYVTNDPDMEDASGQRYVPQLEDLAKMASSARLSWLDSTLGRVAPQVNDLIQKRVTQKRLLTLESEQAGYEYGDWEMSILQGPNFEAYQKMLVDMGSFLKSQGVPYMAVTLPNMPNRDGFQAKYARVEPAFKAAGIPFYDLLDDFVAAYPPEVQGANVLQWGINPANGHPGAISTSFYGREVAGILEKDYPAILGQHVPMPASIRPRINDWIPAGVNVRETGDGEWTFEYPSTQDGLVHPGDQMSVASHLPLDKDHVVLSFDLPVAVKEIRLSGELLQSADMYVTAVDVQKGYDPGTPHSLGVKTGTALSWTVQGQPFAQTVNSLSVSAQLDGATPPDRVIDFKPDVISKEQGLAYTFLLPDLAEEADGPNGPSSQWVLLENGKPLGPPHSSNDDVRQKGAGRYSHWKDRVYFSSSDGSDPRTNGRSYQMAYWNHSHASLKLSITFDEPAVRP